MLPLKNLARKGLSIPYVMKCSQTTSVTQFYNWNGCYGRTRFAQLDFKMGVIKIVFMATAPWNEILRSLRCLILQYTNLSQHCSQMVENCVYCSNLLHLSEVSLKCIQVSYTFSKNIIDLIQDIITHVRIPSYHSVVLTFTNLSHQGPILLTWLTLIPAWINNHMARAMKLLIHSQTFMVQLLTFGNWINNFIPHLMNWCDCLFMVVKEGPDLPVINKPYTLVENLCSEIHELVVIHI